jgi:hypothetical protein
MAEQSEKGPDSEPASSREERHGGQKVQAESEDCRCKEAPGKTLPQLLKVMIEDLAFWKKGKKERSP